MYSPNSQQNNVAEVPYKRELLESDAPGWRERVLLVDDSAVTRRMFSLYLSSKYDCLEAASYDEAIALLKRFRFAVVVTDIIMPGLSGIELLRKVVEEHRPAEVIVISGVDRPQRALDAIRLGAFDYLIKPCEPSVLEATIRRALERRALLLDSARYKHRLEAQNAELLARKGEMQRLQAQVVQNEKMASLGQLAAGVAHELNNPVGFVHANLEMLEQIVGDLLTLVRSYETVESTVEVALVKSQIGYPTILNDITSIVQDCREGSNRIHEIVQNLRTFSRLDEAEYKEIDVHDGIDATVRLLSKYFSAGNIALKRDFGDIPPIGAFAGSLNQVWMNLLANAAQAIGTGKGEVNISTRVDLENVYIAISDTGCGIPVQFLNRIYDPFFTTKPVGEGTGLGLSISFSIVERHGGDISVETRLNQGTCVTVRLPRHYEPVVLEDEKAIVCYSHA